MRCCNLILFSILCACSAYRVCAADFVWYDGTHSISYSISKTPSPVVVMALDMFADDMRMVTGHGVTEAPVEKATVRIVQLDRNRSMRRKLMRLGVPADSLAICKDAFYIRVLDSKQWLVVGSDAGGTAYGILELSRLAGVSPWIWWNDAVLEKKPRLVISSDFKSFQKPSVEYRGIFINDEEWSTRPWSCDSYSPGNGKGMISAAAYRQIFRLLMRLRANTLWPAMHWGTVPFYLVPGAKEAADSCGIVIGTSHCEPLMRNNVGEWNVKERGPYNYIANREAVLNYWAERLKEVGTYNNIYTIGMRGIHDGSMEGVNTLGEKTVALQQVINDQRKLLARYVNKNVTAVPQQFVPYKEVLQIMDNGLKVPDDVMLTWCDDNYGYMTRLADSLQQQRSGGSGVYYHLSYWGRPHDYLWLTTTQPGLIVNEMHEAYSHNARRLWIANVHDVKTAAYDLELFLDMAWNIRSATPSSLYAHTENWLRREFGDVAGKRLLPVMQEYYHLCGIRRPEFMGWNQNELDKKKYSRGLSPVTDTEFSLTEFGGELDRYLNSWRNIGREVTDIGSKLPARLHDAYFAMIAYPVKAAGEMSRKMLEAQRARYLVDMGCGLRDTALLAACANSIEAWHNIRSLTDYYNHSLAGGKWNGLMCDHPRDQLVFAAPSIPVSITDEDVKRYATDENASCSDFSSDDYIARNACEFNRSEGEVRAVQALGHSMNAVSLKKNSSVTFDFQSSRGGEALLRIAVIPTQPNDKGDIRFSVSIDGGEPTVHSFREPYRSETWKQNVLRGQAVKTDSVKLSSGHHTLTIKAIDNHVIVDQWMIDFKPNRKFYVFPYSAIR